ncbi:MAG TPA: AAA family ATPase [Acidimicrobiia bacterium]|nr:AAA family ATPase [Acidimicrobiia bacterium]
MGPADPTGAGIAGPRGSGGLAASALLGREGELHTVLASLRSARSGRGGLVLIGGEPGIGKTRLADEAAARAKDQGVTVLWGKCWEAGGAPAYWPWVQAMRSYIRSIDVARLREEVGSGAGDIAYLLPEIEEAFDGLQARPPLDPELARFHLFDSTAGFLRRAANDRALLILIEDLQAADTASLLLLRFLAGQVSDMSVLLVATYRDVELTREHPLTTSITDLAREPNTRHILLRGLMQQDVAQLIERTAGVVPASNLVSTLHRQTNGNPLFVTEAIRLLAAEGGFAGSQESSTRRFPIPEAVREVILRRLGHLSQGAHGLLTLASVLGHDISFDTLRSMGDGTDVGEGIDEAVGAELLVEVGGGFGRFRFSHDLVREALYEAIPPAKRARLHAAAGEALERLHAMHPEPHLAEIAHHFFEGAGMVGDAARAADYSRRAAEHAAVQFAYEDAARLYRMALHATELQDEADPAALCDLLIGLGDAQMRAGDAPGGRESFLRAAEISRRFGLPQQAAQAALGYGGRFVWARAASDRHLIPLLKDALTAVGDGDSEVRALLLARLAGALRDDLDPAPRDAHSREAVELARRLGDPATLAYALDGRFAAIWAPDTDRERQEIADEIITLAEEIGDEERAFQGHHYRLAVLLEYGDIGTVAAELPVNLRLAEELRQPAQLWYAASLAAILALLEGRFDEAEQLSTAALEHGRRAEGIHSLGVWLLQSYYLRAELGRAGELEPLIRESLDEYAWWPWMRCTLLHLYTEIGRPSEARSLFEAVAARDFADLPWDNDWLMGICLVAEVAVRLGDIDRAETLYALIEPYAQRNGFGHPQFCTGSMMRSLGLLAAALGRIDDAERHFEEAIEINDRMGARPWAAHTRYDLARLLTGRDAPGDRERARELEAVAEATAAELGMVALAARLERGGGEDVGSPELERAGRAVFRREGEYWSIVFDGRSVRVRDSKGMGYLATLLAGAGREHHALDLIGPGPGPTNRGVTELESGGWDDAGAILDPQAKKAYRTRVEDLRAEVAEAEEWNDSGRAERARAELDALTRALAEAVGLGGRDRRAASPAERARLNVTRALRSAMGRIRDSHPELGRHLDATIRTGIYCAYTPDPRTPPGWEL